MIADDAQCWHYEEPEVLLHVKKRIGSEDDETVAIDVYFFNLSWFLLINQDLVLVESGS